MAKFTPVKIDPLVLPVGNEDVTIETLPLARFEKAMAAFNAPINKWEADHPDTDKSELRNRVSGDFAGALAVITDKPREAFEKLHGPTLLQMFQFTMNWYNQSVPPDEKKDEGQNQAAVKSQ